MNAKFFELNEGVNLYAFIGKKVTMEAFNATGRSEFYEVDLETGDSIFKKRYTMDYSFHAEYKVVQKVFNDLGLDTIRFEAYDHSGRPKFENYKYVLLYISKDNDGSFYHQKYQFDPLIKKGYVYFGQDGKSVKELFENRKNTVFKARNIFK